MAKLCHDHLNGNLHHELISFFGMLMLPLKNSWMILKLITPLIPLFAAQSSILFVITVISFVSKVLLGRYLSSIFFLDISNSLSVCCRQPVNGKYTRKIIFKYIQIFENNDCICDCVSPWGSLLLLTTKPHQEGCTNIHKFIWHSCISYRPLNSVTWSFDIPIPRDSDSIENFGDYSSPVYFISLDA